MELIDGNAISEEILQELKAKLAELNGPRPGVAFVRVGEDPASVFYVNKKQKVAAEIGVESTLHVQPESITQDELLTLIDQLNADPAVHGILVQSPLPPHIEERVIFNRVSPDKDVDGFNVINIGKLCQEDPSAFVACTPAGVIELLKRSGVSTSGKRVAVVGRSLIVGKPAALLLMMKAEFGNATVTVCHSRTANLAEVVSEADIIIAAMGKAAFITADMVKDGAVVIDVGINRVDDASKKRGYRIVGDVDFDQVSPKCARITPVPGGVGPMTVAMLMKNTVNAYRRSLAADA
ncbi:bifunctional 5,10-methylenetetrahydrofolate dehydrogenase/5,10-methenyltetrahydrofolate cyclohydrolase [Cerasicoccus arenae]|uniref:Bifunctional protein FolD n=1 Tax=Cerasicoccus arenae TaxID=424488 RepID=A0A8J3GD45_9BACT|nr:bifunctional 5,10-methylenetetrahydrofolate dehydrogenase/5,10-methenyltetrahydrofolate cyclohydrolase [Cerasicoccus arenae]MBK1859598.1 bifunctional 5,10-methylenetetrahydrofolate dehydrogenase/5,10-methenyltetrahydrofolate cyclohydrolase [Cerasicoccus arenae]GHB92940.1 bifunctional protein FolD [Cerasicoccus arenae]